MITAIETRLRSYEVQGEPLKGLHNKSDDLIVAAHRIYNDRVVLDFHGRTITVVADDLRKAIRNATNHG